MPFLLCGGFRFLTKPEQASHGADLPRGGLRGSVFTQGERCGSGAEACAIAHEGARQRVGGLAGGDREDGGRAAGLGGARGLLAAALAGGRTKHFRGPSGGRVEC